MSERRTTVDCQHVEAALIAYLKDGLSPTRRQAVEDHLAACDACTRSLQQAQTLEAELRLQAARHLPTLSPQASARIRERVYRRMRRGLIMQRTIKLAGVAVAVVAIALLAVGVAALWQGWPQEVAVEGDVTPEFSEGAPTLVPPTPVSATSVPPTGVPEATPGAGDTWTRPTDGAVMVYVPAGEFLMGSSDEDPDAKDYEKPQHTVYLDAFWIDKHEVTNDQYRKCVEAGACQPPKTCQGDKGFYEDATKGNYPMVCIGWNQAQDYAAWVGGRLPTEAEWEKAARGTDGRLYPWGNSPPDCGKANYYGCGEGAAAGMLPVGSRPDGASPYGAMDMGGNVVEWVADWWGEGYYAGSPARNPQGPESKSNRVIRGGSFSFALDAARCAHRDWFGPDQDYGSYVIGFRVVVAPGPSALRTSVSEPTSCEEVEGNCLELTFDGEGCAYDGPMDLQGGQLVRVTILFFNESEEEAFMNVWRLEEDRTLQDVIDWCGGEPCTKSWGQPFWVRDLTPANPVPPGQRQTWAGLLMPGNHTVQCGREEPFAAWFAAEFTVEE